MHNARFMSIIYFWGFCSLLAWGNYNLKSLCYSSCLAHCVNGQFPNVGLNSSQNGKERFQIYPLELD